VGTKVTAPNFLIIGAARSGTTALASFMSEHPDVFMSTPKEPHFLAFDSPVRFSGPGDDNLFNDIVFTDEKSWLGLFDKATEKRRGEGSVTTLWKPHTSIPRIDRLCDPEVRLIAVLRDPVDRAFSNFLYLRSRGNEGGDFPTCLDLEQQRIADGWSHMWQFATLSNYADQIQPFAEHYGDRLLVVLQEDFETNPGDVLARVFRHLDIDPTVRVDTDREVNRGGVPKSAALSKVVNSLRSNATIKGTVKRIVPQRSRERLRTALLRRPTIPDDTRSRLVEQFRPGIIELEQILDRDLSVWPSRNEIRPR